MASIWDSSGIANVSCRSTSRRERCPETKCPRKRNGRERCRPRPQPPEILGVLELDRARHTVIFGDLIGETLADGRRSLVLPRESAALESDALAARFGRQEAGALVGVE